MCAGDSASGRSDAIALITKCEEEGGEGEEGSRLARKEGGQREGGRETDLDVISVEEDVL